MLAPANILDPANILEARVPKTNSEKLEKRALNNRTLAEPAVTVVAPAKPGTVTQPGSDPLDHDCFNHQSQDARPTRSRGLEFPRDSLSVTVPLSCHQA